MIEIKQIDRENIQHLVEELEDFEKDKAIRAGLLQGTTYLLQRGRMNLRARMKTPNGVKGNLLKAFRRRVKRSNLGALAGFDYTIGRHAHLVDQGTVARYTRYRPTGVMPALHFWENTRTQEEQHVLESIYTGLAKAINRIQNRQ